jgi:hypothetical protein
LVIGLGAALVEGAGAAFVSVLAAGWGAGVLVAISVVGAAGAGALTALVAALVVSLAGVPLLLLQPVRTSGRASAEATMAREEAREDSFMGIIWFLMGFYGGVAFAASLGDTAGRIQPLSATNKQRFSIVREGKPQSPREAKIWLRLSRACVAGFRLNP